MGFGGFFSKCFVGFFILGLFLIYVPGIPPHVSFSAFKVDPSLPREGPLARNTILNDAEQMHKGHFIGPESIASRASNELFVGLQNGDIVRVFGKDFEKTEVVANLGPSCAGPWEEKICGRPLGLRFANENKLLVADAYFGIFELDVSTGKKNRLVDPRVPIEGLQPKLVDDLDIDDEGNIFWSDASSSATLQDALVDLVSDPTGRLFKYIPATKKSELLLSNLSFANGVQLSPDQKFVLVCETFRHRVTRYWLKGPKAGSSDVFVSQLPGMPDNIRPRQEGGYYVSLVVTRHPNHVDLYEVTSQWPSIRKILTRATALFEKVVDLINYYFPNQFCARLSYKVFHLGIVSSWSDLGETIIVELDEAGSIVGSLQGSSDVLKMVSQTQQVGDYLFFGSPWADHLGRLHIDKKKSGRVPTDSKEKKKPKAKEEL